MQLDLTPEDAQRLINSQRAEINRLTRKLAAINASITKLSEIKAQLPEAFLRAASDICGMASSTASESFLDEAQLRYRQIQQTTPAWKRERLSITDEYFLFAIFEGDMTMVNNFAYYVRQIQKESEKSHG